MALRMLKPGIQCSMLALLKLYVCVCVFVWARMHACVSFNSLKSANFI